MSNLALMEARPPFVMFEERLSEDREESLKQGRRIVKGEWFAIVRAIGAKDSIEKNAEEWLADLDAKVQRGDRNWNPDWVRKYHQMFEQHKAGQESTPDGTHVKEWAAISRAQAENFISAGILTIEDVAAMNEQSLQRVGMNARNLKQQAQDYLKVADKKKAASEMTALRAENENLKARQDGLEKQISELLAKLNSKEP